MTRLRSLAALACSAMVPVAVQAYTFRAEKLYHRSLALMEAGKHEAALEGFMDVILEDPAFPGARDQLRKAARQAVRSEGASNLKEKEHLMEEIRNLSTSDGAPRDEAVADWKRSMDAAIGRLADVDELEEAFQAYEAAVLRTPVSFKAMQPLSSAKAALQKRILELNPALSQEPQWQGQWPGSMKTGALVEAILLEAHNAGLWSEGSKDMVRRAADPEQVAKIRELASSIDKAEKDKTSILWTAVQAFHHYRRDRFADSAALWRKVLAAEPRNAEASFYLSRVEKSLALAKPKAASAYAKTAKEEAIDWSPASEPEPVVTPLRPKPAKPAKARAPRPEPKAAAGAPAPEPAEAVVPAPVPGKVDQNVMREWGQDLYRRGLKAYSLGNLGEAIEYWNNCLGVDPDHPKARKALERARRERK
ncbi:MAG: hypothetical protein HY924_00445 [Elusimicrobia bacterium]|nr:hypothetical protein [Elusimicrobiota bacterium]